MVEWLGWLGGTPPFRKPPYYGQLAEWYEMGFSLRTCGCRTEVTLMNRNIVSKLTIIFVVIWGVIVVKYIHTSKSDFLGILSVAISGTDLLEVPTVYKICVRAMSRATFQGICPQVLWLYIYGLYSASRLGTWSGHWYYGLKLSTHLPTTEPIPGTFLLTSFFPTCQVRVSRFYQSCVLLLPPSFRTSTASSRSTGELFGTMLLSQHNWLNIEIKSWLLQVQFYFEYHDYILITLIRSCWHFKGLLKNRIFSWWKPFWLVVWNMTYFPFHIWDVILPID